MKKVIIFAVLFVFFTQRTYAQEATPSATIPPQQVSSTEVPSSTPIAFSTIPTPTDIPSLTPVVTPTPIVLHVASISATLTPPATTSVTPSSSPTALFTATSTPTRTASPAALLFTKPKPSQELFSPVISIPKEFLSKALAANFYKNSSLPPAETTALLWIALITGSSGVILLSWDRALLLVQAIRRKSPFTIQYWGLAFASAPNEKISDISNVLAENDQGVIF